MGFGIGNVLKMLGGTPVTKVFTVFAEKLRIAKTLDGGSGQDSSGNPSGISQILGKIMQGGSLSSVLQDPTALANGSLTQALQQGAGNISNALGSAAQGLVNAMTGPGGMTSALSSLGVTTSTLSGLSAPTPSGLVAANGSFGLLDLLLHDQTVAMLGGIPGATDVSTATAAAPLASATRLAEMEGIVRDMTNNVIIGRMFIVDATALIVTLTEEINALISNSTKALQTLQDALPTLSMLNTLAASLIAGSPDLQAVITQIPLPDTLTQMMDSAGTATQLQAEIDQEVSATYGYYMSQEWLDSVQAG
jgi:hypothetical protein